MEPPKEAFGLGRMWKEIPTIARVMTFGLWLIAAIVLWNFAGFLRQGDAVSKDDLYIYVALVILVPGAALGLSAVAFTYAYYQLCKQHRRTPFWDRFLKN